MAEIKKCWTCRRYKAYYGKYADRFCKMLRGRCSLKCADVDSTGTCEEWVTNVPRRKDNKKITLSKLYKAIDDINQIKLVLFDNAEEEKSNPLQ